MRLAIFTAAMLAAAPAFAQAPTSAGEFERGFGAGFGGFDAAIEAGTRDANGNRLIVNGQIMSTTTLSGGLGDGFSSGIGSAQAIGNQLNVVTQGNWNTVIIDSTQINHGDISADVQGVQ